LEGVVRGLRGEMEGWERRAREAERRVRELELERSVVGSGASSPGMDSMRMEGDDQTQQQQQTYGEDAPISGIVMNRGQSRPIISMAGKKTSFEHAHLGTHPPSDPDLISDSDSISRQVAMDMACGFCEGIESVCVCRIVREGERVAAAAAAHQQQQAQTSQSLSTPTIRPHSGIYPAKTSSSSSSSSSMMVNPVTKQLTPTYHAEITAAVRSTSILDNLPPVEAAVPLRRRVRGGAGGAGGVSSSGVQGAGRKAPIFAVSPAVSMGVAGVMDAAALAAPGILYIPPAECSGDPRNCPACKDDEFGEWHA
jgi:hypothetical protein